VLELVSEAALVGAADVFEMMARVRPAATEAPGPRVQGTWVSGIVGLGSERIRISLVVHFPLELARDLTARLLGDPRGARGENGHLVRDAVGEIANMIAGRVKSRVGSDRHPLAVSLPAVVEGREFAIAQGGRAERFSYRLQFPSGACWLEGAVFAPERRPPNGP